MGVKHVEIKPYKIQPIEDKALTFPKEIVDKINELVEHANYHFHESLDTHYYTTSPQRSVD